MAQYPLSTDIFGQLKWLVKKVKTLYYLVDQIKKEAATEESANPVYLEVEWNAIANGFSDLAEANLKLDGNFTSMINVGNTQRLYGGSNITLNSSLLNSDADIISINDPSGIITQVNFSQFHSCTNLQYVNLAGAQIIGTGTFVSCSNLKYVNLPVTTQIGDQCFNTCTSLQTVNINKCITTNYAVYGAFVNVSGATITIKLPSALVTDQSIIDVQVSNTVTLIVV